MSSESKKTEECLQAALEIKYNSEKLELTETALQSSNPEKLLILSDGIKCVDKPRIHFDIDNESRKFPCVVGRSGIKQDKKEGDGATPVGTFSLRRVWYRADKLEKLDTGLSTRVITKHDGWCDDVTSPLYNKWVDLSKPFTKSHEKLWLESDVYDIVVEVGYNDDPIIPGKGSAIFMHVARANFTPTAGCVALKLNDLQELLKWLTPDSQISIKESGISIHPSPKAKISA